MFPPQAKPHEVGILIARLLLNMSPDQIRHTFHYRRKESVDDVLSKYTEVIVEFRARSKV